MGYLTNTNHQPIKRRPSLKKVAAVLVIGAALIGGVIWLAQVFQERQTFRKNEQVITGLVSEIIADKQGTAVYSGNTCTVVHLKYQKGPKSCHIRQYLLIKANSNEEARNIILDINKIVGSKYELNKSNYYGTDVSQSLYNFSSNKQECLVSYHYYDSNNPKILFGYNQNLPKTKYSGLFTYIGCSARAKWSYYPMRP